VFRWSLKAQGYQLFGRNFNLDDFRLAWLNRLAPLDLGWRLGVRLAAICATAAVSRSSLLHG
jgi:hypothetical protein